MAKKYDLAVKTGTYKTQEGIEKGRYETLGEVHSGKDGGFFARMNAFRMLGLAMAAVARGDDSVIVSLFAPDHQSAAPVSARTQGTQSPAPAYAPAAQPDNFENDDIPF